MVWSGTGPVKCLLQRVNAASVSVNDCCIGRIDLGLLVFVGVEVGDTEAQVARMAQRILAYRLFPDAQQRMNLSVTDIAGGVLLISQFTLAADTRRGNRPGFSTAATPALAERQYEALVAAVAQQHTGAVATGRFAADMQVALVNDGPVTFLLEA